MKKVSLSILTLFLVAGVFLMTGCGQNTHKIIKTTNNLTFNMEFNKNPPIRGSNTLTITLNNQDNSFVTDADVSVNYSMPGMPGMPPMNFNATAQLKGNSYKTDVNFPMPGSWNVRVKAVQGDEIRKVKFNVDVR